MDAKVWCTEVGGRRDRVRQKFEELGGRTVPVKSEKTRGHGGDGLSEPSEE